MDFGAIMEVLANMNPLVRLVFTILGVLVVAGQAIVLVTPTPADDNFMAKLEAIPILGGILKALKKFAPFGK